MPSASDSSTALPHQGFTSYVCACPLQEWLPIDKQVAMIALGRFESCVRSTLLLCEGYECCEKDGMFTAAFPTPRLRYSGLLLCSWLFSSMQPCRSCNANDTASCCIAGIGLFTWPCLFSVLRNDNIAKRACLDFVNLDHLVLSQSSIT